MERQIDKEMRKKIQNGEGFIDLTEMKDKVQRARMSKKPQNLDRDRDRKEE